MKYFIKQTGRWKHVTLILVLMSGMFTTVFSQNQITVTGTVIDNTGVTLPGVSVSIKGTTLGTVADMDGNFSIVVNSEKDILSFSYLGYVSQEIAVGKNRKMKVNLVEDVSNLDEVVVVGYGTVKRKDLTGATSSIKGGDVASTPVSTAAQAITGKLAGVNVTTTSGAPGADVKIVIRGGTSITQANDPLYIVDGFPMANALMNIPSGDIESIDVLKDASSTAIYGSRGANGVILITTKSGKSGKVKVTYNGFFGSKKISKSMDVMNPSEYVHYQYERDMLVNKNSTMFNSIYGPFSSIDDYNSQDAIDWQDQMYGGWHNQHNNTISLSGGSETSKYYLSYVNIYEDGLISKSSYGKNNVRFKLNQDISKIVHLSLNVSLGTTETDGTSNFSGIMKSSIYMRPIPGNGLGLSNDEFLNLNDDPIASYDKNYKIGNPYTDNKAMTQSRTARNALINASVDVDIMKNLTFKTSAGYAFTQTKTNFFDDGTSYSSLSASTGPSASVRNAEQFNWQLSNALTFHQLFNERHDVSVMIGNETRYAEDEYTQLGSNHFPDDNFGLDNLGMAGFTLNNASNRNRYANNSFFGRASYQLDEKYIFTGTMRYDGSSRFAKGNQWGLFPSVAAAWKISEEDFMKNNDVISNLKLRVGYGQAGNDQITANQYTANYNTGQYSINGNPVPIIDPTASNLLANPDITWETNITTNVGVDFGLWQNRLSGSVDLYRNDVSNLLLKANVPVTTGYAYQFQNVGKTRNQGIEIQLNSTNIDNKAFTWTTAFNIAFNRNTVLELNNGLQSFISGDYIVEVGQSVGQIYGYEYDGLYTTDDFVSNGSGGFTLKPGIPHLVNHNPIPGDVKFKQTSSTGDTWDGSDRTVIGNATPKFTGGLNNTFRYKNFDLGIFLNFVYGNDVLNLTKEHYLSGEAANFNALSTQAGRFTYIDANGNYVSDLDQLAKMNPNPTIWNAQQSTNSTVTGTTSSYYVEDGSFLRVSNITLGYNFSKTWTQKMKVENLRLYTTLYNLHTFTNYSGYDPEVGSSSSTGLNPGTDEYSYPKSFSFIVGLNLTF